MLIILTVFQVFGLFLFIMSSFPQTIFSYIEWCCFLLMKTLTLTEQEIKLLADAVWLRQRCFIAGDRGFKEYGAILNNLLEGVNYIPSSF